MTAQDLAATHALAFAPERGWSAAEIRDLLTNPTVRLLGDADAFALVQTVAGESELLTLAVRPDLRRQGRGRQVMRLWMETAAARRCFLEVAADNLPALNLYTACGFAECGRRKAYYRRPDGSVADAIVMQADLITGNATETGANPSKTG